VLNGGLDLHVGGADFGTAGRLDLPVWNASGEYSSDLFARKAGFRRTRVFCHCSFLIPVYM
jgi:hypothetical protein